MTWQQIRETTRNTWHLWWRHQVTVRPVLKTIQRQQQLFCRTQYLWLERTIHETMLNNNGGHFMSPNVEFEINRETISENQKCERIVLVPNLRRIHVFNMRSSILVHNDYLLAVVSLLGSGMWWIIVHANPICQIWHVKCWRISNL